LKLYFPSPHGEGEELFDYRSEEGVRLDTVARITKNTVVHRVFPVFLFFFEEYFDLNPPTVLQFETVLPLSTWRGVRNCSIIGVKKG